MTIELFTARVCPFAHRTRLVLLEKGVEARLTEIDFENKPARFLAVSPYGRVPALVHDGTVVYESAIIDEYLDEVFPAPPLMPASAALRAFVRIWIDYLDNQMLDEHYALLKERDPAKATEARTRIERRLLAIERDGMGRHGGDGPYWLGAEPTLVDFAYYPFFERLPAWRHYRGVDVPVDCRRLGTWIDAMAGRASVRAIANDAAYYITHYAGYAGAAAAA
ncbi:MAG: glutathione S-transferase family protein [Alphaproteobacteria bacterium]